MRGESVCLDFNDVVDPVLTGKARKASKTTVAVFQRVKGAERLDFVVGVGPEFKWKLDNGSFFGQELYLLVNGRG